MLILRGFGRALESWVETSLSHSNSDSQGRPKDPNCTADCDSTVYLRSVTLRLLEQQISLLSAVVFE